MIDELICLEGQIGGVFSSRLEHSEPARGRCIDKKHDCEEIETSNLTCVSLTLVGHCLPALQTGDGAVRCCNKERDFLTDHAL